MALKNTFFSNRRKNSFLTVSVYLLFAQFQNEKSYHFKLKIKNANELKLEAECLASPRHLIFSIRHTRKTFLINS